MKVRLMNVESIKKGRLKTRDLYDL